MFHNMQVKDQEYNKHMATIKRNWIAWGKKKSLASQKICAVMERQSYGSKQQELGIREVSTREKTPDNMPPGTKYRELYDITE